MLKFCLFFLFCRLWGRKMQWWMDHSNTNSQIMHIPGFLLPFIGGRCTVTAYAYNVRPTPIRRMVEAACREPNFLPSQTAHVVGPFHVPSTSQSIGIQTSPVRPSFPVIDLCSSPEPSPSPDVPALDLSQITRRQPVKRRRISSDSFTTLPEDLIRRTNTPPAAPVPSPAVQSVKERLREFILARSNPSPVAGPSTRRVPEVNPLPISFIFPNCAPFIKQEPDYV